MKAIDYTKWDDYVKTLSYRNLWLSNERARIGKDCGHFTRYGL